MAEDERTERYIEAMFGPDVRLDGEGPYDDLMRAATAMAVADAEQAELRAEVERLTRSLAMREGLLRSAEAKVARVEAALSQIESLAKVQATSCQAAHRADHARNWLDVLAIIERAALDGATPEVIEGDVAGGEAPPLRPDPDLVGNVEGDAAAMARVRDRAQDLLADGGW